MSQRLAKKIAVITGGTSGIGEATAECFVAEGAQVVICGRSIDKGEALAERLGEHCRFVQADVTQEADIERTLAYAVEQFGGLDILVNNAGFSMIAKIDDDAYLQSWEKSLAVMLEGPQVLIRLALPHLRNSDAARIVNISSTEGLGGSAGSSPYTAAKHGLIGLTKSLAVELGKEGITVNAVCPGPIHTGITELIPDEHKATFAHRRTALRRYGRPEEVAHVTLSLCLPAASYVTGVAIPVDGGMRARNN